MFAPESDVKECLELTRNLGDDSLPVDRLCAIEAGPMRDWAGPVLKETAENAIADWPSGDIVSIVFCFGLSLLEHHARVKNTAGHIFVNFQ